MIPCFLCGDLCESDELCRSCRNCFDCCECEGPDTFDEDEFGEDPEDEYERRYG